MSFQTVLAIDLGAESGRVMAVKYDGQDLHVDELTRFSNHPVTIKGTMYWNFLSLWENIQSGIEIGKSLQPASLGVDTWGVDFGLFDSSGKLISNPVHYRDSRTNDMMEYVFDIIPREEIYAQTGIEFMQFNTLYQLMSMVVSNAPQLEIADKLLLSPDLINYWLTGEMVSEFSIASTTQMLNPYKRSWTHEMLQKLSIPSDILPEIVPSGTKLGYYDGIQVIAPACHDTGSAVAAVPVQGQDFGYISSGTWSLVGIEVDTPIINKEVANAHVTNEGGVYDTFRFLRNVMGLWIAQQCRSIWQNEGQNYSYQDLMHLAGQAPPLLSIFNPNDPAFFSPGDHPALIRSMCERNHQAVPATHSAVIRSVFESLALAYRDTFEKLEALSGCSIETIHIIGGGSQNTLLNQMTANATGKPVIAGPVETTVIGNALMQLITLGEINNLSEARQVVAKMDGLTRYEPEHNATWQKAYQYYKSL